MPTPSGTRGLRNKNPGNIKKSKDVFQGEIVPSTDAVFKQFESMAYGYRAIFKIIDTYIKRWVNTIAEIISTYAPASENVTTDYINYVTGRTGIPRDRVVSYKYPKDIVEIVAAISRVENGVDANRKELSDGYALFSGKTPEV